MDIQVNWLAVFGGAITAMAVGFVWYSKLLFAMSWMKLAGLKEEDIKSGPGIGYGLAFLAALLMSYVLAHFEGLIGITDWMGGAITGFWASLGFVATSFGTDAIFSKKPLNLFLITAGYQIVAITLAGAVIALLSY